MKSIILSVVLMLSGMSAYADCTILEQASRIQADKEFVSSAVLQLKGKTSIKLVHTIIRANDPGEAAQAFEAYLLKEYPAYTLATSLTAQRSALLSYEACKPNI